MGLHEATGSQLAAYRTDDRRESSFLERMRGLLEADGDPFSRDHFEPGHFTASAFVLSPDGSKLVLSLHGKLARWLQPGGHFDPGDGDPVEAARREALEETGLGGLRLIGDGLLDVDIHEIPVLGDEPCHEHHDLRFLFGADDWALVQNDESNDLRWFDLAEIPSVNTDASVLRAVDRIRSLPP